MPQVRKRQTKEKINEEVVKKKLKKSPVSFRTKKKKDETLTSSKTKVLRSSTNFRSKRKIIDSPVSSENEEVSNESSQSKKISVQNCSSQRKNQKLRKAKADLNFVQVKDKQGDSKNLLIDSPISSEDKESSNTSSQNKKTSVQNDLSLRKDPKLGKAKVVLHSIQIKDKLSDSENLLIDSPLSSEDEKTSNVSLQNKKTSVQNNLSPRKDPKLGKARVVLHSIQDHYFISQRKNEKLGKAKADLHSVQVKNKPSDSENLLFQNSSDSGISSETYSDASKVKSKPNITMKPDSSTSLFKDDKKIKDESSSSESEWEEVEDNCEINLDDYKPDIPKEGVEITIECTDLHIRKRKKKQFNENEWIRLRINRIRKDIQLSIHKTHLLCLLAHGIYVNKVLNCDILKALALSLIPVDILSDTSGKKVDKIDIAGIEKIVSWFCFTFTFRNEKCLFLNILSSMIRSFQEKKSMNPSEYNLMFIVIARILGFKVRYCVSLYPVTYKAMNLIKKPRRKDSKKSVPVEESKIKEEKPELKEENESGSSKKEKKVKPKKESKTPKSSKKKQVNTSVSKKKKVQEKVLRPRRSKKKSYTFSSDEDNDDDNNDKDFELYDAKSSDEDFQSTPKIYSQRRSSSHKKSNRKVLSSDSEPSSPQQSAFESGGIICWAEIFSKPDKQWIAIECSNNIVNNPYEIEELAPKPVSYILAYDNESCVKDVTRRYCDEYMTATVKLRVDSKWWKDTLDPFLPPNSVQNKAEEKQLDEMLVNKPLPHTIQGFKNHPLYALERHLLKFEAIYPPDAPPVGFIRSEPIFARDNVYHLRSRENWVKKGRVVKVGEQPYKIVIQPQWDRIARVIRTDLPLEVFGVWQTKQYEPAAAVNGKIPRNEYGNVELFNPCMLPKGTVHLQLPGLNRIAKKLGIDCCAAVVGFDACKGGIRPVFDGFIICKEFKDSIIAAWEEEQENGRKREEEKRNKRIYGNWKKLIKGLLIRERIKLKYNVK